MNGCCGSGVVGGAGSASAVLLSVATLADLSALSTVSLASGSSVSVNSVGAYWVLDKDSTATVDGITVVTAFGGGRWFRQLVLNTRWLQQTTWFLDPAGDDENDGETALTALQTSEELTRRISGGAITQDTTITFEAGTYGTLQLSMEIPEGVTLTVQGNVVLDASGTLSAVTDSNPTVAGTPSTRGAVTNTGGDPAFVNQTRLRLTSGANTGALAWSTNLIAANQVNVSRWATFADSLADAILVNAGVGNTYAVESFPSIFSESPSLQVQGLGQLVVRECTFDLADESIVFAQNGRGHFRNGVVFYSCVFSGAANYELVGAMNCTSCWFTAGTLMRFVESFVLLNANVFSETEVRMLGSTAYIDFRFGNCFDNSFFRTFGQILCTQDGDTEFVDNASGVIVHTLPGSLINMDPNHIFWGANNTQTIAFLVQSLSGITAPNLNQLNIPGSTTADFVIGGTTRNYVGEASPVPFVNTANNAAVVTEA